MKYAYADYVPAIKALSDETRLKILDMVSCGEMCGCDILARLSISQSTLSYHMKILTESGLIHAVRDGAKMKYTLKGSKTEDLMEFLIKLVQEKDDCICRDN